MYNFFCCETLALSSRNKLKEILQVLYSVNFSPAPYTQ